MSHRIIPRVPPEGPNARWYSDIELAFQHYEASLTPASVAANTTVEESFTLSGINSHDTLIINPPSVTTGIGIAGVRASAKDEISITFINATGGALVPPSGEYIIVAIRG